MYKEYGHDQPPPPNNLHKYFQFVHVEAAAAGFLLRGNLEQTDFSLIGQRLNAMSGSAQMGGPCGKSSAANGRAPRTSHFPQPPPHWRTVTRRVKISTHPVKAVQKKKNSNPQLAEGWGVN